MDAAAEGYVTEFATGMVDLTRAVAPRRGCSTWSKAVRVRVAALPAERAPSVAPRHVKERLEPRVRPIVTHPNEPVLLGATSTSTVTFIRRGSPSLVMS